MRDVEPDADLGDDTVRVARRDLGPLPPGWEDLEDTVLHTPEREPHRPLWRAPTLPPPVAHHRIRTTGGEIVVLDAPVYLGRRPTAPRVNAGPRPKLLEVRSPGGEISATHLELREAGRVVVVTDLHSTNGTTVHVPGSPGRVLIGGESLVVSPGTLLDLGDGNLLEVLRPAIDSDVPA